MILQLLNVLIGLTLIYLIFSTIASALFELLEGLIRQRGKLLARGIKEILRHRSPDVAADLRRFYEHPLINSLYEGEFSERAHALPSYIPPEHFARAVLMLAEDADPEAATTDPFVQLRAFAQRLVGQRPVAEGESQVQALEAAIVAHFNASMDRVGGWFGRYARAVLLGIGLLLAVVANVDTIQIVSNLSMDPLLADRIADSAAQYIEQRSDQVAADADAPAADAAASTTGTQLDASAADAAEGAADPAPTAPPEHDLRSGDIAAQLELIRGNRQIAESLGLPLGWQASEFQRCFGREASIGVTLKKLVGLLLTALALSSGASFWFELLNQLVKLRTSLKPPPKEPAAAEADTPKI